MKKIAFILAVMSVLLACEKDKNAPQFYAYFTKTNITSTYTELNISFHVQTNGTIQSLTAEYDSHEDFATYQTKLMSLANDRWSVQLSDLKANTEYYLRYRFRSPMNVALADTVMKIKTPDYDKPVMGEIVFMDTTDTGISLRFSVESAGGIALKDVGVCYGTNILPTKENAKYVTATKVTLGYTAHLKDLSPNTKYYIRTYAINDKGTGYSAQKNITTLSLPQVQTDEAEDITTRSALCYGKLLSNGNTSASVGICYASSGEPTLENGKQVAAEANAEGRFSITLPDLQPGTEYAYRAYAQNKIGVGYGEIKKFKTDTTKMPKVKTLDVTNVTTTTATCAGEIISEGMSPITECGIYFGTESKLTEQSTKITGIIKDKSFFILIGNLKDNTMYYYRAYVINAEGTVYGATLSFQTKAYELPVVETKEPTNVKQTTATCAGVVTSDGGLTITQCGICYGLNETPTIEKDNNKQVSGCELNTPFLISLTDLQENTTYYYRAYAVNAKGTQYGNTISFTTKSYQLPTVETNFVSAITCYSANVGGTVTDNGGKEITDRGISYCYYDDKGNLVGGMSVKAVTSTGTGEFYARLTSLNESTTYYAVAYATNSIGTAYGETKTFTTLTPGLPSVTTQDATNVLYTSVELSGVINGTGGIDLTERGFCYGTMTMPTVENATKVTVTLSSDMNFSTDLSGLADNTTYYYRAYAINSKGTAYGEVKTFVTKTYSVPTVATNAVSFDNGKALVSGTISDDGGKTVTERGICYNTTGTPTVSDSKVAAGSTGTGEFSCALSSLTTNTTYYARVYAINSLGTAYGDQISFKMPALPTLYDICLTMDRPATAPFVTGFHGYYTISAEEEFTVTEVTMTIYIDGVKREEETEKPTKNTSSGGKYKGFIGIYSNTSYDKEDAIIHIEARTSLGTCSNDFFRNLEDSGYCGQYY